MSNHTVIQLNQPEGSIADALTELLRTGAKALIKQAVQAELEVLLVEHSHQSVNGPSFAMGIYPSALFKQDWAMLTFRFRKVRDRSQQGIKFNSVLIPPYLKRTESIEDL